MRRQRRHIGIGQRVDNHRTIRFESILLRSPNFIWAFQADALHPQHLIVARLPESADIMARRIVISRAYELADDPESVVKIPLSGRRGDSSQNTRCGLMWLALFMARSLRTLHQAATFFSTCWRQAWLVL